MMVWSHGLGVSLKDCEGSMSWEVWGLEAGVYSNKMTRPEGALSFYTEDEVGPCLVSAAWSWPGALGSLHWRKISYISRFRHSSWPQALKVTELSCSNPSPSPLTASCTPSALSLPRGMSHQVAPAAKLPCQSRSYGFRWLAKKHWKKKTVFSFSLLTFSLQRTGNVKIQSRWPCPIESRGEGNLYTELITKSYIINSGELTGFGHWPSPHPTIKCPTPRTFLHGMLAFASVTCCPFLWMW